MSFEYICNILKGLRDSEIPEDRLFYRRCINYLVRIGERLVALTCDIEVGGYVEQLRRSVEDYKLYPKNNVKRIS